MKILPDGSLVRSPNPIREIKIQTDGRRRLNDWLKSFLDYAEQAESPIDYLRWVGLATISGAAQRKIYMDMELYYVMSNMYIILVGPPGSKKSTAIRQGRKLLQKIPSIALSSDAPSVAGIMEEFTDLKQVNKEHQSLNAFVYELSSLYENAKETMNGFLTAIYDGDSDYIKRTRVGGKEHIPFPWLNLVAGTTPSWLGDNLSKSAIEGGLVAREIHVYSGERILKTPRPKPSPRLAKLKEDLVHDLAHISELRGEFRFDDDAGRWYDLWYMDADTPAYREMVGPYISRFPRVSDNRTSGYYERKAIHLIKVAMAVSLAQKDELVLTLSDLQIALALLESVEEGMARAFSSVGGNTYANDLERIRAQIRAAGKAGLSYSEIVSANFHMLELRMIDATLESLEAMGVVKRRVVIRGDSTEKFYTSLD
jgi:hypothetical protein